MDQEVDIVAIDYYGAFTDESTSPYNAITRMLIVGKFIFCKRNKCWSRERKTKGTIDKNNLFTPYPNQSVTYTIQL